MRRPNSRPPWKISLGDRRNGTKRDQPAYLLRRQSVIKLLLFCVLLIVCWPAALLAIVLYPFVWLALLPFRLVGIVVHGVFELIAALFLLPARVLRAV